MRLSTCLVVVIVCDNRMDKNFIILEQCLAYLDSLARDSWSVRGGAIATGAEIKVPHVVTDLNTANFVLLADPSL